MCLYVYELDVKQLYGYAHFAICHYWYELSVICLYWLEFYAIHLYVYKHYCMSINFI